MSFMSSKPKTMSTLTDQQQQMMNALTGNILGGTIDKEGKWTFGNTVAKGATEYKGQLSPSYFSSLNKETKSAFASALSGKSNATISDSAMENRYRKSVVNPLMQTYQSEIAPAIRESYGNTGAFSSRMGTSMADALTKIGTQATSELANMQWQKEQFNAQMTNDAQNRQLQAAGVSAQLGQQALSNQYQNFLRTTKENNPYTAQAIQLINSQQQAAYKGSNPLTSMIGGIGSGAAAGSVIPGVGTLAGGIIGGFSSLGNL
jgi:hypothetical protein